MKRPLSEILKEFESTDFTNVENHQPVKTVCAMSPEQFRIMQETEYRQSGVTDRHMACTFENYTIKNESQKRYVEELKTDFKSWFLIIGNTGTGKGHLTTAMIKDRIKNNKTAYRANIKKLIDKILACELSARYAFTSFLESVDLLVIDELGRSTEKEYFEKTLYDILDARFNQFKQTVIISNQSVEEIYGKFDEAGQRRLSESTKILNFNWEGEK
jgi:DNA replication protein DnaC